ncbi:hypothetical protein B0H19DRAFT_1161851 [Mycena capillaripes]|nr:hypothetical protein B0H19DRAFT_1161851 [Mycena capillaripes]
MRFTTVFSALAVVATGASAATFTSESISNGLSLTAKNYYGAPTPPWKAGHHPGWYYGKSTPPQGISCYLNGYSQTFYNLTCASQDGSYQTYGLVDTVADCEAMCDSVSGCTFFNRNPQLTCALFTYCLDASTADNCGGQTQPDYTIDYIRNSDGYCKKKPTA